MAFFLALVSYPDYISALFLKIILLPLSLSVQVEKWAPMKIKIKINLHKFFWIVFKIWLEEEKPLCIPDKFIVQKTECL